MIKWEVTVTFACEQAISCATEGEPLQEQARRKHKPYGQSMNKSHEASGTPRLKSYEVFLLKD